jgi:hypothetical protein
MINARFPIEVATHYQVDELDSLLLRKWTDGETCQRVTALQHFSKCKKYIHYLTEKGEWSEADEANF